MSGYEGGGGRRNYERGLDEYVDVANRIQRFYAKYPEGALVTEDVIVHVEEYIYLTTKDGKEIPGLKGWVRVMAAAYRTPDDQNPGRGNSMSIMPGVTPYTRGSELENCETSAWGRAIAAVGLETKEGIATADEIRSKLTEDAEAVTVSITPSSAPQAEHGGFAPTATTSQISAIGGLSREMGMDQRSLWKVMVELNPESFKLEDLDDTDEKEATRLIKMALLGLSADKAGEILVTLMALQAANPSLVEAESEELFPDIPVVEEPKKAPKKAPAKAAADG